MSSDNGKLLLIEDDPFLREWIGRLRDQHYPGLKIEQICNERDFLRRKPQLESAGFKGIILDVMLPWEDGDEQYDEKAMEFSEPRGEYFDAGIRILDDILKTPQLESTPVLIYSVNDQSAVDLSKVRTPQVSFLRKDERDDLLLNWIGKSIA